MINDVTLVDFMGGDARIVSAARESYQSKGNAQSDENLIKYLLDNRHMVPFEHCVFTFHIKCPISVMRHLVRHRHGSFSEQSARYTKLSKYYIPVKLDEAARYQYENAVNNAIKTYNSLLDAGVAKEDARQVLPVSMYTSLYWTVNVSSLINFLRLRLPATAQLETRDLANQIMDILIKKMPITGEYIKNKYMEKL